MARQHRWTAGAAVIAAVAIAAPAARAQSATGHKWEVEFYAGAAAATPATGGTAATLPAGAGFVPLPNAPASRRTSSWLFGDGAALLNSVNNTLAPTARITPLDAVIGTAAASRGSGASAGFRLTRRLGSRYSAELNLDYARTPLRFTGKALDGIEASRSTFITAFRGLFTSGPSPNPTVTATATITPPGGSELLATGVLGVDVITRGKLIPYVVGGAGVAHGRGEAPTAALVGNYGFSIPVPGAPGINETDRVTIRVATRANSPIAVFGGGIRYAVSQRWGIRADVRFLAGGVKHDVLVDARPAVTTSTPGVILISPTNPSAVFSSSTTVPASLTAPAISALRTFSGSGSSVRTNIAGGVFLRF
jgi:hypothetical protein